MRIFAILVLMLPLAVLAAEHGGEAAEQGETKEHGGQPAASKEHGGKPAEKKEHGGKPAEERT